VVLLLVAAASACSDPGFSPALWKFAPTVRLKGSKVGGWQEACAYLKFVDARESSSPPFQCGIKVGMPLATEADGPISPELAARITAVIATESAGATFHTQPSWLGEDYCILLRETMKEAFRANRLGATVNQC
jgi:hypothetical protein